MITVQEFKSHFRRDFPYLPEYSKDKIYFKDDIVYKDPNFYKSLIDNNSYQLSEQEFWQVVKEDEDNYLLDSDIEKAIREAELGFPLDLFDEDDKQRKDIFYYLVAFYLVVDIQNASAGLSGQGYSSFVASKSVGSVSESYGIPSWVQSDPMLSIYMSNGYGKKYLSYLIPRTQGFVYCSKGGTTIG